MILELLIDWIDFTSTTMNKNDRKSNLNFNIIGRIDH